MQEWNYYKDEIEVHDLFIISGETIRLNAEFQCAKGEVSSFRKSRILLDQLQKCMGTILEENNWKREDIIQLREAVQRLKVCD